MRVRDAPPLEAALMEEMVTIKLDLTTTDLSEAYWTFTQILTLTIIISLYPF